jgi:hypothetical protein
MESSDTDADAAGPVRQCARPESSPAAAPNELGRPIGHPAASDGLARETLGVRRADVRTPMWTVGSGTPVRSDRRPG